MKIWKKTTEETVLREKIFTLKREGRVHPLRGDESVYSVLECSDWVNVIAVTEDEQLILIRQFRAGRGEVTLEIPGGMVDPGEQPRVTAVRELEEETGYRPESVLELGSVTPNPAFLTNRCYTYLATGCRPTGQVQFDSNELIEVELRSMNEISSLVASGEIDHALVVAAFFHLFVNQLK